MPVGLVQKDSRDLAKSISQPLELAQRFGGDKDPLPAADRIPNTAPVLGDAASKSVGPAILFDLRSRPRRIHRDGEIVRVKERNGLNAGGGRRGETENLAVQHAVDIHHDQRRAPLRRLRRAAQAGAEARCLHRQKIPRVPVPAVELLSSSREPRVVKVARCEVSQPCAGEQLVEKKPLLRGCVTGFSHVPRDESLLFARRELKMKDGVRQIVDGVDDVEFPFSQTVVFKIRLDEGRSAVDPLLTAHFPVDERRKRARASDQIVPNPGPLQDGRRLPSICPAEQAGECFETFVLVGSV